MIYVDSSVLLELYLGQPRASDTRAILSTNEPLVSSWLLAVEVPTVLRRLLGRRSSDSKLLSLALTAFDGDSKSFHLVDMFATVAARVRSDVRLSGCRTLDAVHLTTAVLVREETGANVALASFDTQQRRLADKIGLGLIG